MTLEIEPIVPDSLPGTAPRPLGGGRNLTKAVVFLDERNGAPVVVKTVEGRPWVCRALLGGLLLRREARILAKLEGAPGVPRLVCADRTTLVTEWLPGARLFDLRKTGIDEATAAEFASTVRALHERGFAHGDIGRRDVLVAPDGRVSLVDFATAVGPGSPPVLWRLLLPIWRLRERSRVRRLTARYRRRFETNRTLRAARSPTPPAPAVPAVP